MKGVVSRALFLRRIAASLLLCLFAGASIEPVLAALSASEATCDMPCCKRGAHGGKCCCRKKHPGDGPARPEWRETPPCPPNCARTAWGFSSLVPPAVAPGKSAIFAPRVAEPVAMVRDAAWRPSLRVHALFQRPPPSFIG